MKKLLVLLVLSVTGFLLAGCSAAEGYSTDEEFEAVQQPLATWCPWPRGLAGQNSVGGGGFVTRVRPHPYDSSKLSITFTYPDGTGSVSTVAFGTGQALITGTGWSGNKIIKLGWSDNNVLNKQSMTMWGADGSVGVVTFDKAYSYMTTPGYWDTPGGVIGFEGRGNLSTQSGFRVYKKLGTGSNSFTAYFDGPAFDTCPMGLSSN
jgi:hypothetical protein